MGVLFACIVILAISGTIAYNTIPNDKYPDIFNNIIFGISIVIAAISAFAIPIVIIVQIVKAAWYA